MKTTTKILLKAEELLTAIIYASNLPNPEESKQELSEILDYYYGDSFRKAKRRSNTIERVGREPMGKSNISDWIAIAVEHKDIEVAKLWAGRYELGCRIEV